MTWLRMHKTTPEWKTYSFHSGMYNVGSLETLAMLEVSWQQRISVLPTALVFRSLDRLLGYNCIWATWINYCPYVSAGWLRAFSGRLKHGLCLLTERLELPSSTCRKVKLSFAFPLKAREETSSQTRMPKLTACSGSPKPSAKCTCRIEISWVTCPLFTAET